MYKAKRDTLDALVELFKDSPVTTTDSVFSAVVNTKGYDKRSVMLVSTLDEIVTATVQGCIDEHFTHSAAVGAAVGVTSSVATGMSRDDYYPYIRVMVVGDPAPTTGTISGWVMLKV